MTITKDVSQGQEFFEWNYFSTAEKILQIWGDRYFTKIVTRLTSVLQCFLDLYHYNLDEKLITWFLHKGSVNVCHLTVVFWGSIIGLKIYIQNCGFVNRKVTIVHLSSSSMDVIHGWGFSIHGFHSLMTLPSMDQVTRDTQKKN